VTKGPLARAEQRQPDRGVILLRDYPAGEVVRIDCRHYLRAGRDRLAALIERYGPAAEIADVLEAIAGDYPRRTAGQ
jgi:hypothetical protein